MLTLAECCSDMVMLLPFTGVAPVRRTRAICGQEGFDLTPSLAKLGSRRPDCGPVGLMSWTATGSSQWGHGPPGPTLRAKVLQSAAALDAQGPGPAGLALVDRGGPGQAGREGCRCLLKGPPRPLAAGGRAVALPAGRDEATPAGGAGHRRGVVAHGAHAASLRALRSAS